MNNILFSDVVGAFNAIDNLVFMNEIDSLENLESISEAESRLNITSSIVMSNKSLFVPGSILDRKYIFFMSDSGHFDKRRVIPDKLSSLTIFKYYNVDILVLYKHELEYTIDKIDILEKSGFLENIRPNYVCIYDINNEKDKNKAITCLNRLCPNRSISIFLGEEYSAYDIGEKNA